MSNSVILGPPRILKVTRAIQFEFYRPLDMGNYSFWVFTNFCYKSSWGCSALSVNLVPLVLAYV